MKNKIKWAIAGAVITLMLIALSGAARYAREHWFFVMDANDGETMMNICSEYLACAPYPDTPPPLDRFWICESTDGRINDVIVRSDRRPHYLPVAGNENVDFRCRGEEIIDL